MAVRKGLCTLQMVSINLLIYNHGKEEFESNDEPSSLPTPDTPKSTAQSISSQMRGSPVNLF